MVTQPTTYIFNHHSHSSTHTQSHSDTHVHSFSYTHPHALMHTHTHTPPHTGTNPPSLTLLHTLTHPTVHQLWCLQQTCALGAPTTQCVLGERAPLSLHPHARLPARPLESHPGVQTGDHLCSVPSSPSRPGAGAQLQRPLSQRGCPTPLRPPDGN